MKNLSETRTNVPGIYLSSSTCLRNGIILYRMHLRLNASFLMEIKQIS